jgi:tRNA threonylcarbamoyladenosine biosynthesis protein TsaB
MLLAIDSSTSVASLALWQEGEVLAEVTWHTQDNHTAELLPNLLRLLEVVKTGLRSVKGIAVAKGPGSFNGLRVGLSTAKGLALALDVPLAAISTLEVEAFPHAATRRPLCPVHNAGRGEVAVALFEDDNGIWLKLIEEHITTLDVLLRQIPPDTLFCGELSPDLIQQIVERCGAEARIVSSAGGLRRAGYLAELGWRRLSAGDHDDIRSLQALYLRRPPITVAKPKKLRPFSEGCDKDVAQKYS